MTIHDPTTLNRQGADKGTQYRSIVLYHDQEQKAIAKDVFKEVKTFYEDPIVTELAEYKAFYEAEEEHHFILNNLWQNINFKNEKFKNK